GSHFDLVAVGNGGSADVSALTGAQIETNSQNAHVTGFERPEDGAWDTLNPNRFYFVTTASPANYTGPGVNAGGHSKLWQLDFVDAKDQSSGGTVKLLLDGTEGQSMLDNISVSPDGKITMLEDVGNNARLGRVWQYDPSNDPLTQLAVHDSSRFLTG